MNVTDREATQEFSVLNALTGYCGQRLTRDLVDRIVAELVNEMRTGPTAWAFRTEAANGDPQIGSAPAPLAERVQRLIDACEGELDGLAIDADKARLILFHVDCGFPPPQGEAAATPAQRGK